MRATRFILINPGMQGEHRCQAPPFGQIQEGQRPVRVMPPRTIIVERVREEAPGGVSRAARAPLLRPVGVSNTDVWLGSRGGKCPLQCSL